MNKFRNKTVLVVDDFSNMRGTLRQMLSSIGFQNIHTAINGNDAIDLISKIPFDIVLCDYNLGEGKDGQQVLEEVRHRKLLRRSAIFFMITAENTTEMVLGAVEYKPDGYLTKPFTKELLRKRLDRQLDRKTDLNELEKAVEDQDFQTAIAICDRHIAAQTRNAGEFVQIKVELCLNAGRHKEAEGMCQRLLAERSIPWAAVALGKALQLQGRLEEARTIFQEQVQQNPMFMEAHDGLAKTLIALGDVQAAEEVLANAATMSPRAILRQRMLGEVAIRNGSLTVAERAYRKTVQLGRESVFRDPAHYTALSDVLVKSSKPNEAIKLIETMRSEFVNEGPALLQAVLAEGRVYTATGREADAKKAFSEAIDLHAKGVHMDDTTSVELAKAYIQVGETDKGVSLLRNVVRNNHEDADFIAKAKTSFMESGLGQEVLEVITSAQEVVTQLNNKGVELVKQGQLEEANRLFEEAAKEMPDNRTIALNAAQALLMLMEKSTCTPQGLATVRERLTRVRQKHPSDGTLHRLWAIYKRMAAKSAPSAAKPGQAVSP
jgi:tetratricopeptide (TPR) repeat protein